LPHYERVTAVAPMVRSVGAAARAFAAALARLDVVWIFGPHPVSLVFVGIARARRVPVVLGVRQDFPRYVARRLPSRRWLWSIPAAHGLDRTFRALGRRLPTVVVGEDLAARYRGRTHGTAISLVPRSAVAAPA